MSKRDTRTLEEQERDEGLRRAADREARLDEPLRRRDVIEALETVAARYSPYHESHTIELLGRIVKALS